MPERDPAEFRPARESSSLGMLAIVVVAIELAVISWIRYRYMDTPLLSAAFQVMVGGALVFIAAATWSAYISPLEEGSVGDFAFKLIFIWAAIATAISSGRRAPIRRSCAWSHQSGGRCIGICRSHYADPARQY